MTPEEHELLRRSIALSEENNDILRGIQRSMRMSRFLSVLYWLVIVGITVGAWYFAQPYMDKATAIYNQAQIQLGNISNAAGKINNVNNDTINGVSGVAGNASSFINDAINSLKKAVGK